MGIFLLWATWAHECMAIFVNIDGHRTWGRLKRAGDMILIKAGEMMAVAVKQFQNFLWSGFLIIRQNVNMATNAILYCGLAL